MRTGTLARVFRTFFAILVCAFGLPTTEAAPVATTLPANSFTPTNATLNGTVLPNGLDTTAWFAWGTTTNYGSNTPVTIVSGTNSGAVSVINVAGELSPGTVYHYQLLATNSSGAAGGGDLTFAAPAFTVSFYGLPALLYGSVAWGDFDNDGKLDILLTGGTGFDDTNGYPILVSELWRNNGDGTFSLMTNAGLPGIWSASVALGDYDNDGYLDILMTGSDSHSNPFCQLWRNNGNWTFTRVTNTSFPGFFGVAAWGDFDNDGRLDILLSGWTGAYDALNNPILKSQVWHNNGNGTFVQNTNAGLPGANNNSLVLADFDNDGWLDVLLTGISTNSTIFSQLWRNKGDGTFVQATNVMLPGVADSSVATGDFNNDGWPDIVFIGRETNYNFTSEVWTNKGNGTFAQAAVLTGLALGSVAVGDFDNDGWPDILQTGDPGGGNSLSQLWRNLHNGAFANLPDFGAASVNAGSVAWGDYDNDGRLDILLTGQYALGSAISQVARNLIPPANTPPTAPTGLAAEQTNGVVVLHWNAAGDTQTPSRGLSYNLRVGTTPGGNDIVSPAANSTNGFRRLPQTGNAQQRLMSILSNLSSGTYYWSVQAVDAAFAGSPFAPEATFTIANKPFITSFGYQAQGNRVFQVQFNGFAGTHYTLEASTNLTQWSTVTNATAPTNGIYQWSDSTAINYPKRFYRLSVP